MAIHRFISVIEGGYFYCFQPNIKEHPDVIDKKNHVRRTLFEIVEDGRKKEKNQYWFIIGKFIDKQHSKKDHYLEFEQSGRLLLHDDYTESLEQTHLTSTIYLHVDKLTFEYNFLPDMVYKLEIDTATETIQITELNPF